MYDLIKNENEAATAGIGLGLWLFNNSRGNKLFKIVVEQSATRVKLIESVLWKIVLVDEKIR